MLATISIIDKFEIKFLVLLSCSYTGKSSLLNDRFIFEFFSKQSLSK